MTRVNPISIRLNQEAAAYLTYLAEKLGISKADVINMILNRQISLDDHEMPAEVKKEIISKFFDKGG